MTQELRSYIDTLFAEIPPTKKTVELKEEMLQNLTDKYDDLIRQGKSEEAAYNIVVAGIGDVDELLYNINRPSGGMSGYSEEAILKGRQRSALLTAIAVMLYILSVIPVFFDSYGLYGLTSMFAIVAIATGILIYNSMTKLKPRVEDDTLVEEFKEWSEEKSRSGQMFRSISGALWSITLAIYFIVSFLTMAWYITWIIFLISAAVNSILKAVFDFMRWR